jgi:zinc/manganese transport system substrate-binding protein
MKKGFIFAIAFTFCVLSFGVRAESLAVNETPISIVASFSIIDDMIKEIGGDKVAVQALVGPDEEAHDHKILPADIKALAQSEIIAINGLKFEDWLTPAIKASETKAKLLVVSAGIKPRALSNHGEMIVDPHAWQSLRNGQIYATNIAKALIAARPQWADMFRQRAKDYIQQMKELDAKTERQLSAIPESRRFLVTMHNAMGYWAGDYGFKTLSLHGYNPEAQPKPSEVATIIEKIKEHEIRVLFPEHQENDQVIEQIAKDSGIQIGPALYTDALSEKAPRYLDLFETNVKTIADALK